MKIGILTYHYVVNDGSLLQAFCLQRLLESRWPGHHVELIDYRPRRGVLREYARVIGPPFPFFRPHQWAKFRAQRRFLRRRCLLSPRHCLTDDIEVARRYLEHAAYDVIVVGSDTVWEVRPQSPAPLAPNVYFLPAVVGPVKISFAASMDKSRPELLEDRSRRQDLLRYLSDFDMITVRDAATRDYLEEIGVEHPIEVMPDPTLLWDFRSIVETVPSVGRGDMPLAGLAVLGSLVPAFTHQLLRLGYQVVNLLGRPGKDHVSLPRNLSFGQRVGLFGKLDVLITDRFHGSIFALRQQRARVIFVEPDKYYPHANSKGRDLFRRLGLERMVWRYDQGVIPPDVVDHRLEAWTERAWDAEVSFSSVVREAQPALDRMRKRIGAAAVPKTEVGGGVSGPN